MSGEQRKQQSEIVVSMLLLNAEALDLSQNLSDLSIMHFRYLFGTKGYLRASGEILFPISFLVRADSTYNRPDLYVKVRKKTKKEYLIPNESMFAVEINVELDLPLEYDTVLKKWSQHLIQQSEATTQWRYQQSDGSVVPCPELRSDFFPSGFEKKIKGLQQKFLDRAVGFVEVLRWRLDEPSFELEKYPLRTEFSFDKEQWYPLPRNNGPSVTISPVQPDQPVPRPLAADVDKDIKDLSSALIDEGAPIYHSMFIEARNQHSENPRSALVMGTAALEAAVKRCISMLIPGTAWLLDEMPSPPVFKILRDYIPTLPVRNRVRGQVLIPKSLRTCIQKGIAARNKIIHVGEIPEDAKDLQKYRQDLRGETYYLLFAVKDVIWLLDYYQGRDWALNYVRKGTLESMGIKDQGNSSGVL